MIQFDGEKIMRNFRKDHIDKFNFSFEVVSLSRKDPDSRSRTGFEY